MNKFGCVAGAALVMSVVSGSAMATSQLTASTWNYVPPYDYYPTETTIDREIDFISTTTPDSVASVAVDAANYSWTVPNWGGMTFTGSLDVTTAGLYTFFVAADDAARISIDGTAVVENAFWGNYLLNSPQTASIYLTAGAHAYDAFTWQLSGGQAFNATISGPDAVSFASAATAAVPETATWAMFIGGFGFVGGALRRRQRTTVRFA